MMRTQLSRHIALLLFFMMQVFAGGAIGPALPKEGFGLPGIAIPADAWSGYFGENIEGYLIDPQGLLEPVVKAQQEEFLSYHAGDAQIIIRVMMFEAGQRMPSDLAALGEKRLGELSKPTALVLYLMGEPERSQVFFSKDVRENLSLGEMGRVASQTGREASEKRTPEDQLAEYCEQLSMRLYWMERSLDFADPQPQESNADKTENAPIESTPDEPGLKEKFIGIWEKHTVFIVWVGGTLLALFVAYIVSVLRRRCRFPEFEVDPRLGGAHGAGIGAVISFGSTTQSASSQRERTTDCLGGI